MSLLFPGTFFFCSARVPHLMKLYFGIRLSKLHSYMQSWALRAQTRLHTMQSCGSRIALYAIVFGLRGPMSAYSHVVWGINPKLHDYMQTCSLRGTKRLHSMQSCFARPHTMQSFLASEVPCLHVVI